MSGRSFPAAILRLARKPSEVRLELILTILACEPLHGYGMSQRLSALSHDHFRVNPGSLFPSLYRLEQDGKLKAAWRPSENNRKAKYYALTASGRRQFEQRKRRWERVSFAISSVLARPGRHCRGTSRWRLRSRVLGRRGQDVR
jgi:transcriptional regulator